MFLKMTMDLNTVRIAVLKSLAEHGRPFVNRQDRLNFTKRFYDEMGLTKEIPQYKNAVSSVYKGLKVNFYMGYLLVFRLVTRVLVCVKSFATFAFLAYKEWSAGARFDL